MRYDPDVALNEAIARLAEVEAERDTFKRAYSRASENGYTHAVARSAAEARLAEVEAERDALLMDKRDMDEYDTRWFALHERAEAAEARLAEVEAERDRAAAAAVAYNNEAELSGAAALAAEARLAEVLALCEDAKRWGRTLSPFEVRAAAQGGGGRGA